MTVTTLVTTASLPAASLTVYVRVYSPKTEVSTSPVTVRLLKAISPSTLSVTLTPASGSNSSSKPISTLPTPEMVGGIVSTKVSTFVITTLSKYTFVIKLAVPAAPGTVPISNKTDPFSLSSKFIWKLNVNVCISVVKSNTTAEVNSVNQGADSSNSPI